MDVKITNVYNAYNVYNNNIGSIKTDKTDKTAKKDSISISAQAEEYQAAHKALAKTPDIREEKTAALAAKVAANSYNIDADAIAARMLTGWEI